MSLVKYIVPFTTTGPVCRSVDLGQRVRADCVERETFERSIWENGENRSPASVRLYAGQSAPFATDAAGVGVERVTEMWTQATPSAAVTPRMEICNARMESLVEDGIDRGYFVDDVRRGL